MSPDDAKDISLWRHDNIMKLTGKLASYGLMVFGLVLIALGAADYLMGFTLMPAVMSVIGVVLIAFGIFLGRKPKETSSASPGE
jgi:hypothetical protein